MNSIVQKISNSQVGIELVPLMKQSQAGRPRKDPSTGYMLSHSLSTTDVTKAQVPGNVHRYCIFYLSRIVKRWIVRISYDVNKKLSSYDISNVSFMFKNYIVMNIVDVSRITVCNCLYIHIHTQYFDKTTEKSVDKSFN